MPCKVLHVLRHGVAVHNQPNAHQLPPASLLDPSLTVHGVAQANAAKSRIQALRPQLVLTSPLTRALQTATTVMASPDDGKHNPTAAAMPPPVILALEIVREAYGALLPDKRRSAAELRAAFSPAVDLSMLSEEDQCWKAGERETLEAVHGRARILLRELLPRHERHVLLVSHGVFLECLLREALLREAPQNPDWDEQRQVLNCELYSVIFVEVDPSFLAGFQSPSPSQQRQQHLLSPSPRKGQEAQVGGRFLRRLLLTPGTHDLLAASGLGAGFMEEVVCWAAQLFLAYSQGCYRLSLPQFTQLLGQCGVKHDFVCLRYFVAMASRRRAGEVGGGGGEKQEKQAENVVDEQQGITAVAAAVIAGGLSFEDFLIGLVAMDRHTANAGVWRSLRAELIFRVYDLDDDGDLALKDFILLLEDMAREGGEGGRVPADRQAVEVEARKLHKGGRVTQAEFVSAVESKAFQGTGCLFRTLRSPIKCDTVARQAFLDGSPPPSSPTTTTIGCRSSGAGTFGGRRSSGEGEGGGGGSGGRPPHGTRTTPTTTSTSVVKVNSRQICFDVSKQRYSMSPHEKDPHKKLLHRQQQQELDDRRQLHQQQFSNHHQQQHHHHQDHQNRRHSLDEPNDGKSEEATAGGGNPPKVSTVSGELQYGSGPPNSSSSNSSNTLAPMSPGQGTAHRIIRLLLDWDPNQPLPEPGVLGALVGGLSDLEPLFKELQVLLSAEPTVLEARTPTRIFGDIHGQLGDLLRLFKAYGRPDRFGGRGGEGGREGREGGRGGLIFCFASPCHGTDSSPSLPPLPPSLQTSN